MSKVKQKEVSDDTNQPTLGKFFGIEKIKTRKVTNYNSEITSILLID